MRGPAPNGIEMRLADVAPRSARRRASVRARRPAARGSGARSSASRRIRPKIIVSGGHCDVGDHACRAAPAPAAAAPPASGASSRARRPRRSRARRSAPSVQRRRVAAQTRAPRRARVCSASGMALQQVDHPGQRVGGRVLAGQQHRRARCRRRRGRRGRCRASSAAAIIASSRLRGCSRSAGSARSRCARLGDEARRSRVLHRAHAAVERAIGRQPDTSASTAAARGCAGTAPGRSC